MSQSIDQLLAKYGQQVAQPAEMLAGDPQTKALLSQRIQEGLQGPRFDFGNMAQAIAQSAQAPVAGLRTAGMSAEQVNKEYEKTGKLLDQQLQQYLSSTDKANQQQNQMFTQALQIRQSDLMAQREQRQESVQHLQLLMQNARDKIAAGRYQADMNKQEKELELLDEQINQTKANTERLNSVAEWNKTRAAQGNRKPLTSTQRATVDALINLYKGAGGNEFDEELANTPEVAGALVTMKNNIDKIYQNDLTAKMNPAKALEKRNKAYIEGMRTTLENASGAYVKKQEAQANEDWRSQMAAAAINAAKQ